MKKTGQNMIQLNKNENLYGPAPDCYDVVKNISIDDFIYYSRSSIGVIEQEIAKRFNISVEDIILGYGAEDIIKTLFTLYISQGDNVLLPAKSWWYYNTLVEQRNANPINYPLDQKGTEFITNIKTILEYKKKYNSKLILVCAPNNPTGNYVDLNELEELLKVHKDGIVCLDETYWGFTNEDTTNKIIELLEKYSNLIVVRSFSKYYALAGVRIGYAFSKAEVRDRMKFYNKILGFNRISERLAVAALNSNGYYGQVVKSIIKDREMLFHELNKIDGITAYKSSSNFILVKIPNKIQKPLDSELKKEGIIIKFFTEPSFIGYARISLGTEIHNQTVLSIVNKLTLKKMPTY